MNNKYVIESQYFPVINWFKLSTKDLNGKIEAFENFQKMSFRNRCMIAGSNGIINLTVPLKNGREQTTLIREIEIDHSQQWQKQHWGAIVSSYNRSPFFEHYGENVKSLLFKKHIYLFDLNLEIIDWITKILKPAGKLELTNEYVKKYEETDVLDCRNRWLPKNYMAVEKDWTPKYIQVFEEKLGFLPNLSILDALFCKGGL